MRDEAPINGRGELEKRPALHSRLAILEIVIADVRYYITRAGGIQKDILALTSISRAWTKKKYGIIKKDMTCIKKGMTRYAESG